MNQFISSTEAKGLPLNFVLSIPTDKNKIENQQAMHLVPLAYFSTIHQNKRKRTFEGYYKSITRKI